MILDSLLRQFEPKEQMAKASVKLCYVELYGYLCETEIAKQA